MHSGVDLERFTRVLTNPGRIKESLGLRPAERIVGAVTRLEPVKGNEYLLRAWPKVVQNISGVTLLIVGDGSQRAFLEVLSADLGVRSRVLFTGMREDIPELLSVMEFLVLPSINEGLGRVLIEAAAMGKPAVGTRVCGIPYIIQDGKTGLIVPPADHEALAGAVTRLLDHPETARTMGGSARQWVTGSVDGCPRFSKEAMMKKLTALYREYGD